MVKTAEISNLKVLITGGSGLIGRYLTSMLLGEEISVSHLSRKQAQSGRVRVFCWDPEKQIIDPSAFNRVDCIIHLAGANIGEKRWTKERRDEIIRSRVDSARLLHKTITENHIILKSFISASAIGYYGSVTSEKIFKESDPSADDFLGTTCKLWEEAADLFKNEGIRTVKIRTGVVMERNDSALARLLVPAALGLFPISGNGYQYLPWIHISDLCNIYLKAVKDETMEGAYNAVAPQHIQNREFMRTLAKVMNRSFLHPPVPALVFKTIFGQMSDVILKGSRVSPDKIINAGYKFTYDNLAGAHKNELKS
jgi:uncharacterized protein (TIGR01777 family)